MSSAILDRFPVQLNVTIAWGEMDSFQHVNNLVYLRWFESARMAYLDKAAYQDIIKETGIGPILRDQNIRYRIPLTYPGEVISATRVTRIEKDRFNMEHIIYSKQHNAVAASGESTIVCINYPLNKKAPIPEQYYQQIIKAEPIQP